MSLLDQLFKRKWTSLVPELQLEDPSADIKNAVRVSQYKVSEQALYKPDDTYLPFKAVSKILHDKTSVHVTGCWAGGIMVDRLVVWAGEKPFIFTFDTAREVARVEERIAPYLD